MQATTVKSNGIHYTPPALAEFLAAVTAEQISNDQRPWQVLDPACGDGILLEAFAKAVPPSVRRRMTLVGYDTSEIAIDSARKRLESVDVEQVVIEQQDFLEIASPVPIQRSLFDSAEKVGLAVDVVISNPPYVRTQVLGAARAQLLAEEFGLTGRVDLYHAFTMAMANVLRPGGILGLLTSNRFLTIRSGATLRRLLSTAFDLQHIYDLGDTKLFSAAVLPAIIVAKRSDAEATATCRFDRIYEHRSENGPAPQCDSILEAVRNADLTGLVRTDAGLFNIERGHLSNKPSSEIWTLQTQDYRDWLATVDSHRSFTFEDVAQVKVGIKTTADEVFIRDDWNELPAGEQPERELLRPLLRHFDASRWASPLTPRQSVLYPHQTVEGKRRPIRLEDFPHARRYLESHRERLTRRHYVIDGGRQWYEIWVPHNPADWTKTKIVFPDISAEPRFFLDKTGAIVNGDCYWMTLRPGVSEDYLLLMLAVANSSFITRFYDIVFHNKLYAGRRRFMTQYVKRFPLPDIKHAASCEAVKCARQLIAAATAQPELEAHVDDLVWKSFGLVKEIAR